MNTTRIALSSWVCKYPDDLVPVAISAGFDAVEWDLNYIPLPLSTHRLASLRRDLNNAGISVRFHLPYSTCDVGHQSKTVREASLKFLQLNIDLIAEMHGSHAVVHFAALDTPEIPVEDELEQLVAYGNTRRVELSIENTIYGITSNATQLARLARKVGCGVTLDTGHLRYATSGESGFDEFVQTVAALSHHVHFYYVEDHTRTHLPFVERATAVETAKIILRYSKIDWWTCEMDILDHCKNTKAQLLQALNCDQ